MYISVRKPKQDQDSAQADPIQTIYDTAKASATWKEPAAILRVSDHTLRRLRDELELVEHFADEIHSAGEREAPGPVPDE